MDGPVLWVQATTSCAFAIRLERAISFVLHLVFPRCPKLLTVGGEQGHCKSIYKGTILAAGGFNAKSAEEILVNGGADLVAIGRMFTSNPDLPSRLKNGYPLADYDRSGFWGGTERSYTDFLPYEAEVMLGEPEPAMASPGK